MSPFMSSLKLTMIKSSWALVATPETGELFYRKLFDLAPELEPMFHYVDIKDQSCRLIQMVTVAVNRFDNFDELLPELRSLAKRHTAYGVRPQFFAPVGHALLWALETQLQRRWTPELAKTWAEVYNFLTNVMIEAIKEAEARPCAVPA